MTHAKHLSAFLGTSPQESIYEKCLRNSKEAIEDHNSGRKPLVLCVLEHHLARVEADKRGEKP